MNTEYDSVVALTNMDIAISSYTTTLNRLKEQMASYECMIELRKVLKNNKSDKSLECIFGSQIMNVSDEKLKIANEGLAETWKNFKNKIKTVYYTSNIVINNNLKDLDDLIKRYESMNVDYEKGKNIQIDYIDWNKAVDFYNKIVNLCVSLDKNSTILFNEYFKKNNPKDKKYYDIIKYTYSYEQTEVQNRNTMYQYVDDKTCKINFSKEQWATLKIQLDTTKKCLTRTRDDINALDKECSEFSDAMFYNSLTSEQREVMANFWCNLKTTLAYSKITVYANVKFLKCLKYVINKAPTK